MGLSETFVETYVYMPADFPDAAATNAERLLSEASESVWGGWYSGPGRAGYHGRRAGPRTRLGED